MLRASGDTFWVSLKHGTNDGLRLGSDGGVLSKHADDGSRGNDELGNCEVISIDANSSIEDRDEADGPSRREKVRDSIIRYANRFMDPTQMDRVTVIVRRGKRFECRFSDLETDVARPGRERPFVADSRHLVLEGPMSGTGLASGSQ